MKQAITENDLASQTFGWQPWAQPHGYYQNLGVKVLAVGIASVLATFAPLQAEATIQTVTQEVSLINQPVDIDADGIPDLFCKAGEDTDVDNWTNTSYLYCHTFGGARIWGSANACLSVTANQEPSTGGSWQAVCELSASVDDGKTLPVAGSSTGPSTKTLGIRTSGQSYGWINVVVNTANTDAKAVSWTYDDEPPNRNGPPPVLPGLTAEVINGQASLSWENKNESGITGFKIYRGGQLIATTLAGAQFYTDSQFMPQQCSVTYEVNAVNAGGGVSRAATVTINIPNCVEPTPPSRLFVKVDAECAGRVTTSPDVGINCATSDCQWVTTPKGEKELNCKPAQCSASLGLDQLGKPITLIPHLEAGCEFLRNWKDQYNWGGHDDCADGELTVMAGENKMCIAFFHKVPSSGQTKSRIPPSLPITLSLPSLGKGMEICPDGQHAITPVQFNGGVSVNGGDYQPVVTVKTSDLLKIRGMIRLDSQHLPLTTDIFVHASYQATGQDKPSYLMMDENDKVLPWDANPAHLVPFRTEVSSKSGLIEVEIFQGKMLTSGRVALTFGYQLEDGKIICGSQPIEINVEK
jgi:hypothetical protein